MTNSFEVLSLDALYAKAAELAGRPVEVVGTKDQKYIVEWFAFGESPPPKADSEAEALEQFIECMKVRVLPPEVASEAIVIANVSVAVPTPLDHVDVTITVEPPKENT